jgi:hypothetical protein
MISQIHTAFFVHGLLAILCFAQYQEKDIKKHAIKAK